MRMTVQKIDSHWSDKYIVDSMKIKTVPRIGDYITIHNETYKVHRVTIDYDNNEWIHVMAD